MQHIEAWSLTAETRLITNQVVASSPARALREDMYTTTQGMYVHVLPSLMTTAVVHSS